MGLVVVFEHRIPDQLALVLGFHKVLSARLVYELMLAQRRAGVAVVLSVIRFIDVHDPFAVRTLPLSLKRQFGNFLRVR